jgi:hypothetical protein
MHKLYKEIGNTIEDTDLPLIVVADFIESTKQELSDYLHGKKGLGFRKLLKLSYFLYPSNQKEIMENWCLRLNSTESIKQSFEYASITRNKPLLNALIEKHREDKSLTKYIAIYSILYDFYTNKIGAKDLISRLGKIGQLKGELSILCDIIKCYNYYFAEKYWLMLETAKDAEERINSLGDRHLFLKECYLHRIAEVLGNVGLFLNDLESARYYANLIINANICAKTVSDAYYLLGMSYLSEDKERTIKHLQTRYEISKLVGDDDIETNARRDLDFTKLYLNDQLAADSDPILLRLQSNKGSEFELKLIKEAIFQQGDDDFLTLINAIAKNSLKHIHECRRSFAKQHNYYFASVAAREAKKMGESSEMINEFIDYKIEIKGDVEFEENFIKCFSYYSDRRDSVSA